MRLRRRHWMPRCEQGLWHLCRCLYKGEEYVQNLKPNPSMYWLITSIGLFLATLLGWKRSSSFKYAPGPYRWPVAGNAFQVSTEQTWLQFSAWGREFGDMIYLRIFSRSILILNSTESIKDLFEKKSSNFSDRPRRAMAELSGFGPALAFRKNDESVRQTRKLLHSELNFRAVTESHGGVIEENARRPMPFTYTAA